MIQYKTNTVTVFQSQLYETTSTIIKGEKAIVIVDPTWLPNEILEIRQYVNQIIGNKQLYLVITHSDFDHIIGVGAFPEAMIIASESFENNSNKQAIINEINQFDQQFYLLRPYEIYYPEVNKIIKENKTYLRLGDLECTFYLAPGHTDDGLFFYIKNHQTLIVGDYLSDIEFPFITSSYADYLQTVKQMEAVTQSNQVGLLIPGHGQATKDYQKRIDFSLWYLEEINKSVNIESDLIKRFHFYQGMQAAHKNNIKLSNKEKERKK